MEYLETMKDQKKTGYWAQGYWAQVKLYHNKISLHGNSEIIILTDNITAVACKLAFNVIKV